MIIGRIGAGVGGMVAIVVSGWLTCPLVRAEAISNAVRETSFLVGPVVGWDRNELTVHGPRGQTSTLTDTEPEYGLFLLLAHRNLALNDFLFYSHVNDCDVDGNLLYGNYYGDRTADATWNVGGGYLYHRIKPENEDIRINVPLAKAGPYLQIPAMNLTLNPYVGYAWEGIDTQHGDQDNEYYLYGLAIAWRWRMVGAAANYYYQDARDGKEDFQTLHARINLYLNKHWGFVTRVDYMEHPFTRDTSILVGPSYVF